MIKDIEELKKATAKNQEYIKLCLLETNKTLKVLLAAFSILAIINIILLIAIL